LTGFLPESSFDRQSVFKSIEYLTAYRYLLVGILILIVRKRRKNSLELALGKRKAEMERNGMEACSCVREPSASGARVVQEKA